MVHSQALQAGPSLSRDCDSKPVCRATMSTHRHTPHMQNIYNVQHALSAVACIKPLTTLTYLPRPTPKKPENSKSSETYSQEARELQEEGKAWAAHCARTEIPANPGGPRPPRAPGQRQGAEPNPRGEEERRTRDRQHPAKSTGLRWRGQALDMETPRVLFRGDDKI